ncbi:MAG: DUF4349 domain-containing protein [Dehalococcoidia bacterium]
MKKMGVVIIVVVSLLLVACTGGGSDFEAEEGSPGSAASDLGALVQTTSTPAPFPTLAPALAREAQGADSALTALEAAQRQVISTASVSVEVEGVQAAVTQVRAIAEGLGGFVERLSSSGDDDRQQATITVRVPQEQFFAALEEIQNLGEVRSQSVGSEDVTEQFIDLEARLRSALREEQSLLSLLDKTETVGEVLTIERELSRVRSEIEGVQGRLNFLERRVELATITVSLFPPPAKVVEPPSASLTVRVSDVTGSVEEIKALVSTLDGVVDQVILSIRDGKEKADISLRVFASDFSRALASIEGQGDVQSKELREGKALVGDETAPAEEPDARVSLALTEKAESSNTGLIVAIVAPIGGVALALVLGALAYLAYWLGRRRSGG